MNKKTPLYNEHVRLGAKIVEFAGFQMPVQYTSLIEEHNAVRNVAGIFDVSHMGEFEFTGPEAATYLQWLTANDVSKLIDGKAHYSLLCNEQGGVVDDILLYRFGPETFMMVVNAANIDKDWNWVTKNKKGNVTITNSSDKLALIAFQGPKAIELASRHTSFNLQNLKPFHFQTGKLGGVTAVISRTGYTGEDGIEIFCETKDAVPIWQTLIELGNGKGALPVGLGARDTLRLEARMSLYGHEITDTTNPLEAGLSWVVKLDKGDFLGKKAIVKAKEKGLSRKLIGLKMIDKGIPREGYKLSDGKKEIGYITSGTFSPTLGSPIGLGYLPLSKTEIGTQFYVDIRNQLKLAEVTNVPFYKRKT